MTVLAGIVAAGLGYATTTAARRLLDRTPPGGARRWERVNHRGEPVTLLSGLAAAAGLVAASCISPGLDGRTRGAALLAVGVAGGLGAYDDLAGSTTSKGLTGHLKALGRGEVTSGAVKLVGIGLAGVAAGALLRRNPADAILAGGVIAGTANLVNLLDLRPGRALKAAAMGAVPTVLGPGSAVGGSVLGTAAALLPEDLGERAMLGDAGANAAGAALGVALAASSPRPILASTLAGLVALTLASERISFTRVIESTPGLREVDALGRRGAT